MRKRRTRTTNSQVSVDKLGYESLRPEQETVVREFFKRQECFAALPTGYGKSLCCACLPYVFDIALFPGPRPASCRLQYGTASGTASDGKLGEALGMRLLLTTERLTLLKVDQKAKFVPRGMSAQFVDEAQCDPRAMVSVCEGKAQLEFF